MHCVSCLCYIFWHIYQDSANNSSFVGWSLLVSPVENPQNGVE